MSQKSNQAMILKLLLLSLEACHAYPSELAYLFIPLKMHPWLT